MAVKGVNLNRIDLRVELVKMFLDTVLRARAYDLGWQLALNIRR